jgi:hypothetical protein
MTKPNNQIEDSLIYGLIVAAERHPDQRMRLEAVRQLASYPYPQVHNALAALALWDGSKQVREAAFKALQNVFGDDTDAFLKDFQGESEPLDEEDLIDEPEEAPLEAENDPEVDAEDEFDEEEFDDEYDGEDEGDESDEFFEGDEESESTVDGGSAPIIQPMYTQNSAGQSPVMMREGTPWWAWVVLWVGIMVVAWLFFGQ